MIDDQLWMWADRGGNPMSGRLAEEMREAIGDTEDDGAYLPGEIDEETIRKVNAALAATRRGSSAKANPQRRLEVGTIFLVDLDFERAYLECGDLRFSAPKKKMPPGVWDLLEVGAKVEFEPGAAMEARRIRVIY